MIKTTPFCIKVTIKPLVMDTISLQTVYLVSEIQNFMQSIPLQLPVQHCWLPKKMVNFHDHKFMGLCVYIKTRSSQDIQLIGGLRKICLNGLVPDW